jgi:hypothetical protein
MNSAEAGSGYARTGVPSSRIPAVVTKGFFEVRLWRGHSGNLHAGPGVEDELDKAQRVLLFLLGLLVKMRR